mgnify:CR=1 FL=1
MASKVSPEDFTPATIKQFKIIVGGVYLSSYIDELQVTDNLSAACTFHDKNTCELVAAVIARGTSKQVKIQILNN